MKRFSLLLFVAFFALVHQAVAQGSFIKVYTSAANGGTGQAAIQTSDGGYALTGQCTGFPSYIDVFLMKTDNAGNMLWYKTFGTGDLFNIDDSGYDLQQTFDGGYVIAAESQGSAYGQIYLIKTNASGDTTWTRQYTYSPGFGDGFSIRQTADSGYIVAGTGSVLTGSAEPEAALIKLDKNGTLVWSKLFGGSGADLGMSAKQTADGGFILASRSSNSGSEDVRLVRTNEDGDTLWVHTFGSSQLDYPEDVIETSDGGFLVTGRTNVIAAAEKFLLKTNSDGDLLWVKTYGPGWMNSVMETSSGYVFGGLSVSANGMLTGTDFNGNVLWAAQYGGGTYVNCYRFSKTSDGGFITTGNYFDGTIGGLMLMKTEPNGVVACHYTDALGSTTASPVSFSTSSNCIVNTVMPTLSFATVLNANPAPDDTIILCNTLSISELNEKETLNARPIPANDLVTIDFENPMTENVFIAVYDVIGKLVYQDEIVPTASSFKLNVSQFKIGTYIVTVSSPSKTTVRKISVQR